MKQLAVMLSLLCGFTFIGCKSSKNVPTGPPKSDVEFAKEVFRLMAAGDAAAAEMLDWENLTVGGVHAGPTYRSMPSERAREGFRKSFIKGYSDSFKSSGGNVDAATNWREESKDATRTIVAADGPGGNTLLITVVRVNGQQKVSSMDSK